MTDMTRKAVESLMCHRAPWSVSILMPVHKGAAETRQDSIRLKNLVAQAEQRLVQAGMRASLAAAKLDPLRPLLDDSAFWYRQSSGLAVFVGNGEPQVYRVPLALPELAAVGERFHLKPCLPLVGGEARFCILALSQNSVRFFEATRFDVQPAVLEGAPASFAEAMKFIVAEQQLQFHTGSRPGGQATAVFHGQGGGTDEKLRKVRLVEYCRMIDAAVSRKLGDGRTPLVLAAAEPLLSIYKEVNTYRSIHAQAVHGNPERLEPRALHAQAFEAAGGIFEEEERKAADRYRLLAGTGFTSNDLRLVVPAAHIAQVGTLFTTAEDHAWGTFDPATLKLEEHAARQPRDEDLLDLAAVRTSQNGGAVFIVTREAMPDKSNTAVIFRFAAPPPRLPLREP